MNTNITSIKRGTTPTLSIIIYMPYENIKHIDFIFKRGLDENYPKLHEVGFNFPDDESIIDFGENSFVVNVELEEEDTRKLTQGVVYMDTRIVLTNNKIPKTEILEVDVGATLFDEVYKE